MNEGCGHKIVHSGKNVVGKINTGPIWTLYLLYFEKLLKCEEFLVIYSKQLPIVTGVWQVAQALRDFRRSAAYWQKPSVVIWCPSFPVSKYQLVYARTYIGSSTFATVKIQDRHWRNIICCCFTAVRINELAWNKPLSLRSKIIYSWSCALILPLLPM